MTPSGRDFDPSAETRLRHAAADRLRVRAADLVQAALVEFPTATAEPADLSAVAASLARLLAETVREGRCDHRNADVIGLATGIDRVGLAPSEVFAGVYGMTLAAVADLGHEPSIRAASPTSLAADFTRRAAFDLLAAWATQALQLPTSPAIRDGLTTLHTRAMFETVLAKECQRAERFEHWLSLLLIEVSDLADINRTRGHGVGDQVLERMSILIRRYFRQHDWVARYGDSAVAVLLPETGPEDAVTLAGLMRTMIQERMSVDDERQRPVAVSVAVASARPLNGHPVDADRILEELDAALEHAAGNETRIESVEIHPVIDAEEPPAEP
jgi:diguanylate cyclase (GGDEF)-like protein